MRTAARSATSGTRARSSRGCVMGASPSQAMRPRYEFRQLGRVVGLTRSCAHGPIPLAPSMPVGGSTLGCETPAMARAVLQPSDLLAWTCPTFKPGRTSRHPVSRAVMPWATRWGVWKCTIASVTTALPRCRSPLPRPRRLQTAPRRAQHSSAPPERRLQWRLNQAATRSD